MQIASVTGAEQAEFLAIVNAEIRPDRANTTARDDFPVILHEDNRTWQLVARTEEGRIAAGIACLIREFKTNWGDVQVAGVGSVVTRPEYRGQGLSSALQNELLSRLKGKNVPLAVLWTDQPEIYAGRGFVAAGWELHVDFSDAELSSQPIDGGRIREFVPGDTATVEALYQRHPLHTRRQPGDSRLLYNMPGTRGLVCEQDGAGIVAAAFCGKGADFPEFVAEWSGDPARIIDLLGQVRDRGWASWLLAPGGSEALVETLTARGAGWLATPSGYWTVLHADPLCELARGAGAAVPDQPLDPTAWLGCVSDDGLPRPAGLSVAVWGFDSV